MKLFFIFHLLSAHLQHKSDAQSASGRGCEVEKHARSILLHFILFCLPVFMPPLFQRDFLGSGVIEQRPGIHAGQGRPPGAVVRLVGWLPSPGGLWHPQSI